MVLFVGSVLVACRCTRHCVDPTRPYPELTATERHAPPPTDGSLRVQTDTFLARSGTGFHLYQHQPYSIYDGRGRRVRGVRNNADDRDGSADVVTLPAGRYLVRLEGGQRRGTTFWVNVDAGQLATIDTTR
jgi:hypothetical protein